jgi:hypothetical protein
VLHSAVLGGSCEICEWLVDVGGVSLSARNARGLTAINISDTPRLAEVRRLLFRKRNSCGGRCMLL